ncbi:tyrosine-type recombinase/integrase [Mycolicibacterium brisbanense]|uniref:Phage integrase family protein n=1 Tax=Mycolicibacterium brisbanense TaxID=146020 RepID=A0A100W0H1_9MYCO|nr:tyrosine-type recombinase/integrase [Mycolicibacterium brisbanense]MCV7161870.1 tyrosine-type recombinase/integrase [Mycolicibacterium brisbanense]GAS89383.1 phage integrase family protein [Mycolicibacterium brisbanense]
MARIQKRTRADGQTVYVVKWRTPDGKDRSKGGFRTKKAADAYATRQAEAKLRGVEFDPSTGGTTFREVAQGWLASRHDLKPTTLEGHRYALAPAASRRGDGKTLGIDAVFGGYPLNKITRTYISDWVQRLVSAGKKPSTVRHAYFLVRMVLAQAVVDGRLAVNPADYVKLPGEHSASGGTAGVVDDPDQFLTAAQVSALAGATPWPYNVYVHVAAWAGPRAAELCGLQLGDVELPVVNPVRPNAATKPGVLRVERTARVIGSEMHYLTPKTKGSRRRIPLTEQTTMLLRDYLAKHPRRSDPTAPMFPGMVLKAMRPTGVRATTATGEPDAQAAKRVARRQADALADLSVEEAETRLELKWDEPLRHATFYKAVYRPAVLRANRIAAGTGDRAALLSPELKFHSLRHTYASLCVAAGITPLEIARFMGHAKVTTTLAVYAHLFEDDHADAMAALGAMSRLVSDSNIVQLWQRRG